MLCNLCSSITLDNLPEFPASYMNTESKWDYIHAYVENTPERHVGQPGLPHHRDLDSLKASANQCELCRLIVTQINLFIDEFRGAEEDVFFRNTHNKGYPQFDLWVTKRRGGGEGFWVVSTGQEKDRDGRSIFLLAAFGACVADDDPLAAIIPGRLVHESANGTSLARIKTWVVNCNQHAACTTPSNPMPTRVIDVGTENSASPIRLHEPESGARDIYIALSHCWGLSKLPITTKATFLQRKKEIKFDEMSKNFQDAIIVTRALGVKYLWIDSLCIRQDDPEDWEREAAKMCSVYSNAYLTISATGAKDGTVGCFATRESTTYVKLEQSLEGGLKGEIFAFVAPLTMEAHNSGYITMDVEPLSDRAWCFQERVLSRRIVHFTKNQMYFECMEGFQSEDGLRLPDRYYSVHSGTTQSNVYLPGRGHSTTSTDLSQWNELLWGYGLRKLTKKSDKLPAISGIAAAFAEKMDDRYVAGLWAKSMVEGLLWQGLQLTKVDEYRAPSWSWASVDGIPGTGLQGTWDPLVTIVDYHVEVKGENPFGEVKTGWIKLEAPLLPLSVVGEDELTSFFGEGAGDVILLRTPRSGLPGSLPLFDFISYEKESAAVVKSLQLFALVLALDTDQTAEPCPYYHSLLVTPASGGSTEMRRVGVILQEADTMVLEEIDSSRATVTLI